MMSALQAIPSQYELPKSKGEGKSSIGGVSNWERAEDNVPFSVQHRYGTISNTYSGILHVISLFYANLRDAAAPEKRQQMLSENVSVANGMIELANLVLEKSTKYEKENLAEMFRDPNSKIHEDMIAGFLNAYRLGAKSRRIRKNGRSSKP